MLSRNKDSSNRVKIYRQQQEVIECESEAGIPEVADDDFDMQVLENDLEETFGSKRRKKEGNLTHAKQIQFSDKPLL